MAGDSWGHARAANTRRKIAAQTRFLQLVAEGSTARAAISDVGRVEGTLYEVWMKDPDFRRKYAGARARGKRDGFAGKDFIQFREVYFDRDTPEHHALIIEAMESAAPDTWTMILAPPEAAKTSLLVDYINFKLGPVDPNYRIAVVSENQILAKDVLFQVGRRMTDHDLFPAYVDTFGPFRFEPKDRPRGGTHQRDVRRPWNTEYLTVLRATHDEKDPSLIAKGVGSQIYGARYDLMVIDDIQSLSNLNETQKLLRWLQQHAATRLTKGEGRMVILGSRVGPGDIYEALLDADLVDRFITIPALNYNVAPDGMVEGNQVGLEEVRSYWPGYWDLASLAAKRRKVGEETWQRSYMQRPGDATRTTFREDAIQNCLDPTRAYPNPGEGLKVLGVDPALGGWVGLLSCAFTYDRLFVTDLDNVENFDRTEQLIDLVRRHVDEWRPAVVLFEQDGWGKGLSGDDRMRDIASRYSFTPIPHVTRGVKADPALGVASMASSFSMGEISIPWGDEASQRRFRPLVDELRAWRTDDKGKPLPGRVLRQDLVMALWFCWRYWRQSRPTLNAGEPKRLWRPSWMAA